MDRSVTFRCGPTLKIMALSVIKGGGAGCCDWILRAQKARCSVEGDGNDGPRRGNNADWGSAVIVMSRWLERNRAPAEPPP